MGMMMVDRACKLLHPRFHQDNLEFIIRVLLDNNYPIDFIFNVNLRLKYLISKIIKRRVMKLGMPIVTKIRNVCLQYHVS